MIGLGRMGLPVCTRLVSHGFAVTGTDLISGKRVALEAIGATWSPSAAAAAAGADVLISVLPATADVTGVIDEVVAALAEQSIWIEMSTAAPAVVREIHAACTPKQPIRVLDAPVGGGPDAARDGRLLSFVGGEERDLKEARDVLEAFADRIVHVGPSGSGYLVKLLANALWFGQAVAASEALTVACSAGLDPAVVRDALGQSAASSRFLVEHADALLAGDDLSTFGLARCCDQLAALLAIGQAHTVPLQLVAALVDIHRQALAHYGDIDGELLGARWVADRAGVSFGTRRPVSGGSASSPDEAGPATHEPPGPVQRRNSSC